MIIFKNYFKIVKNYLPIIVMYTFIFISLSVISTSSNSEIAFTGVKPNVSIINNDTSSLLTNTFIEYVENNANIVDIDDDSLKDALFFREVDYILVIPDNFSNLFVNDNVTIEVIKVPDSYIGTYSEMLFNRFWNIARVYLNSGMDEEDISNVILDDLSNKSDVILLSSTKNNYENVNYFFNFANYVLLAITIYIVGMIINVFNDANIKKRNIISNLSYKRINNELFLANVCIISLIWLLYAIISVILYRNVMLEYNGLLLLLNSFVFSITALGIGFFVGNLVKNKEVQSAIVNVVALGSSFISGAFVPQQFLGDFVLTIAKVTPSYWYIKNNNDIVNISTFNLSSLQPILINMLIILIFGLIFFITTNIVSRIKLKRN